MAQGPAARPASSPGQAASPGSRQPRLPDPRTLQGCTGARHAACSPAPASARQADAGAVVGQRLKLPGMRPAVPGAEAIIALRGREASSHREEI